MKKERELPEHEDGTEDGGKHGRVRGGLVAVVVELTAQHMLTRWRERSRGTEEGCVVGGGCKNELLCEAGVTAGFSKA